MLLGIEVQGLEVRVGPQVEFEGAGVVVASARSACAEPARVGVLRTVEAQPARRVDAGGDGPEPPVDEIEVVAGLVHEQAAGVLLLAVPAAEVVCAVLGVEHPGEVDRGDLPDRALLQDLPQRTVARGVAVIEGDDHVASGAVDRIFDRGGAGGVDREGLLDDDVGTGIQRPHDELGVQVVARADDHAVHLFCGDHLLQAIGGVDQRRGLAALSDAVGVELRTHRVRLEDRHERGAVGVGRRDRVDVHLGARAGAGECVAEVGHRWLLRKRFLSVTRMAVVLLCGGCWRPLRTGRVPCSRAARRRGGASARRAPPERR